MTQTQTEAPMGLCPTHNVPFVHRKGTSKAGKPYDFWACPEKVGDAFCQEKPSVGSPPFAQGNGGAKQATPAKPATAAPAPADPASIFTNSAKVKATLKLGIFGDFGTGKTHLALTSPGRKAVIDMEQSATAFKGRFEFELKQTTSVAEAVQALEAVVAHPDFCDTLIIDPLTEVSENLRDQYAQRAERRNLRGGRELDDADMNFTDWNQVKRHWKRMMRLVLAYHGNIILVCREAILYEKGPKGDQDLRPIGFRPAAESNFGYYPDTVVRLFWKKREDGSQVRAMQVYKDRWGVYVPMQVIEDPTWAQHFQPILDRAQSGEARMLPEESPEATEARERDYLQEQDRRHAQAGMQSHNPPAGAPEDPEPAEKVRGKIRGLFQSRFCDERGKADMEAKDRFLAHHFGGRTKTTELENAELPYLLSALELMPEGGGVGWMPNDSAPPQEDEPSAQGGPWDDDTYNQGGTAPSPTPDPDATEEARKALAMECLHLAHKSGKWRTADGTGIVETGLLLALCGGSNFKRMLVQPLILSNQPTLVLEHCRKELLAQPEEAGAAQPALMP